MWYMRQLQQESDNVRTMKSSFPFTAPRMLEL